jgi:hypothetical protein
MMRAQAVFNRIALSGRYFNTGKVLIGLTYVRAPRAMSRDEETFQALLLREPRPHARHEKAQ